MAARIASVAVLVFALVGLAACGGGDDGGSSDEREPLRVGSGFELDAGSVGDRVAYDTLRETKGIASGFTVLGSPTNTIVALQRGDIDIAQPGLTAVYQAIQQGAKLKIFLIRGRQAEYVLVADGADTPGALRGQRIGYHGPDDTKTFAEVMLERGGLTEDDVDLIELPESSNRATALLAGRLDAAVLEYGDWLRVSAEKPSLSLLGNAKGAFPFPATRVTVVTEKFAEENADLLEDVADGLLEGYENLYTDAGQQRWVEKAKETALEGESDEEVTALYRFYRDLEFWPTRDSLPSEAEWARGARFRIDQGLWEEPVLAFDDVFDLSFWEAAQE